MKRFLVRAFRVQDIYFYVLAPDNLHVFKHGDRLLHMAEGLTSWESVPHKIGDFPNFSIISEEQVLSEAKRQPDEITVDMTSEYFRYVPSVDVAAMREVLESSLVVGRDLTKKEDREALLQALLRAM